MVYFPFFSQDNFGSSLDLKTRNTKFVNACWGRGPVWSSMLKDFKGFLEIDEGLNKSTVYSHLWRLKIIAKQVRKPLTILAKEDLREFLRSIKPKYALETYSGFIKTIRVFFRDYLDRPKLATFKFPSKPFIPKILDFDKEDLQRFYYAIDHPVVSMMFLGYCVTGLRRNDLMCLMKTELKRDLKMIVKNKGSRTKHRWITFYNEELANLLHEYLDSRKDDNPKVFPISRCNTFQKEWKLAKQKTGLNITPKDLRDWFCVEMTELGVRDRYIDAFCGRVPKSILARHYTDYSLKRLKRIYDKAGLKVLS